ncbi:MAG: TIM barrel protein [Phycisphaeraceae bacterium]|nr:TIM barrel protein [Phycisphaeraceae bacterium]
MRIKQSFCYPMFQPAGMGIKDLCQAAAKIGYQAVETWARDGQYNGVSFAELLEAAKSSGLAVASMCGHQALDNGLNKLENHDRIEAELRESIDLAVKHRIAGLICFSGNRNRGQSDYEGLVACAKILRRVAPYAEKKGINLNVELLNSKVDHPGYQADRSDWGVALCEMVNSPRVRLLFDIYHMQIMEGDVIRSIRKAIGWIGHFHTAGNPGRNDMDDTQEMNYRGISKAIAALPYDLYVGHELKPLGDAVESLRQSFLMCDVG